MPPKASFFSAQAVREGLNYVAASPVSLFALLFLMNALGAPYRGLFHDAKLYAGQALNAVDDRFASDLFFEYGSQAKYTVFPRLYGPVCAYFGPHLPFLIIYIASQALWLFALIRFCFAVFGQGALGAAAACLAGAVLTPLGGNEIFHVNESWFTPRIASMALCLLAFRELLQGRLFRSAGFLTLGLILHPLMTAPGWLVWLGWFGWPRLARSKPLRLAFVAAVIAGTAVLVFKPEIGYAALGKLDSEWRQDVLLANGYADPLSWSENDLTRLSATAIFTAALIVWSAPPVRRLLILFLVLGLTGLVLAAIAARSPFALLLQGQAYRWIWPLESMHFPLAAAVTAHLWPAGGWRRALGIFAFGTTLHLPSWSNAVVLAAVAAGCILPSRKQAGETASDWPAWVAAIAVVVGSLVRTEVIAKILLMNPPTEYRDTDLSHFWWIWMYYLGPVLCLAFVCIVALLCRACSTCLDWRAATLIVVAALGVQAAAFELPRTEWGRQTRFSDANLRFVQAYLASYSGQRPLPSIYWPGQKLETIWFEAPACSFFNSWQLSGNYFNRGNAVEGQRRAILTRAFEIDALRRKPDSSWNKLLADTPNNIYRAGLDFPEPTLADFQAIAADPQVDFAVLHQEFPGLFAASNGSVFVYDCRALRAEHRLGGAEPHDAEAGQRAR